MALPVVDDNNVLLGIVTIDDILWVANEEFSEDMQKMGGTEALDEPYFEMPILKLFRKRVGWMVILFLGEMLTATAMGYFEDEIAKAVVLALVYSLNYFKWWQQWFAGIHTYYTGDGSWRNNSVQIGGGYCEAKF